MKNLFFTSAIILGLFTSGFATNSYEKLNNDLVKTLNSDGKEDLTQMVRGLCTGSVTVIGSDGSQKIIEMKSFTAANALDCSDKFLGFVREQSASYEVVSYTTNYAEDGVK